MLQVGDKIVWAEIKEGGSNKRFLLPADVGIVQKLQALLGQYPGLFLIRHGEGIIQSAGTPSAAGKIFESMEYTEDMVFGANQLYSHPDINAGSLRYSKNLTEAIVAQEAIGSSIPNENFVQTIGTAPESSEASVAPAAPASGVDELRAKLAAQSIGTIPPQQVSNQQMQATSTDIVHVPVTPAPPAAPPAPADPEELRRAREKEMQQQQLAKDELRHQLEANKFTSQAVGAQASYEEHKTLAPYVDDETPKYLIAVGTTKLVAQMYDKVNQLLAFATVPGKGVTGKQLASWFRESIESRGYDQTFEILASKLKGLE